LQINNFHLNGVHAAENAQRGAEEASACSREKEAKIFLAN